LILGPKAIPGFDTGDKGDFLVLILPTKAVTVSNCGLSFYMLFQPTQKETAGNIGTAIEASTTSAPTHSIPARGDSHSPTRTGQSKT